MHYQGDMERQDDHQACRTKMLNATGASPSEPNDAGFGKLVPDHLDVEREGFDGDEFQCALLRAKKHCCAQTSPSWPNRGRSEGTKRNRPDRKTK